MAEFDTEFLFFELEVCICNGKLMQAGICICNETVSGNIPTNLSVMKTTSSGSMILYLKDMTMRLQHLLNLTGSLQIQT